MVMRCKVGVRRSEPVSWTVVLCRGVMLFHSPLQRNPPVSLGAGCAELLLPSCKCWGFAFPSWEGVVCQGALSRCRNGTLSLIGEVPPGCVALQSICYAMSFSCLAPFLIDQDGNVYPRHLAEKTGERIQSPVSFA